MDCPNIEKAFTLEPLLRQHSTRKLGTPLALLIRKFSSAEG
jgi:hypothetical protein